MPRSAAYRIAFASALAFAAATILLGLVVYMAVHATLVGQLDGRIAAQSRALSLEYVAEGRKDMLRAIAEQEDSANVSEFGYALFDASGRQAFGRSAVARPPLGLSDVWYRPQSGGRLAARAIASQLPDGSRLVVMGNRALLARADQAIFALFASALAVELAIGVCVALLLGTYLRRRFAGIEATAQAIMAGDLDQRVRVGPRGDEFDRLGALLNAMLDRVTGLLENLRQISSDVAHDLRTPLTRLRNGLESGLKHSHAADERDATIVRAIERSDEVLALFSSLLQISEIEAGKLEQSFVGVDLSLLVRDMAETYSLAATDSGRKLDSIIAAGAMVRGNRELLALALINLLDNAQIHTPSGTAITLVLSMEEGRIRLSIADTGPGVLETDREKVLRRFTRLDASRSRPGHGLGLSLVAAIARLHDAGLTLSDNRPGLIVTLEFPAIQT